MGCGTWTGSSKSGSCIGSTEPRQCNCLRIRHYAILTQLVKTWFIRQFGE